MHIYLTILTGRLLMNEFWQNGFYMNFSVKSLKEWAQNIFRNFVIWNQSRTKQVFNKGHGKCPLWVLKKTIHSWLTLKRVIYSSSVWKCIYWSKSIFTFHNFEPVKSFIQKKTFSAIKICLSHNFFIDKNIYMTVLYVYLGGGKALHTS